MIAEVSIAMDSQGVIGRVSRISYHPFSNNSLPLVVLAVCGAANVLPRSNHSVNGDVWCIGGVCSAKGGDIRVNMVHGQEWCMSGVEDNRCVKSNVEHCGDFLEYRFIDAL